MGDHLRSTFLEGSCISQAFHKRQKEVVVTRENFNDEHH
jgi:hypothetical protein